MIFDGPSFAGYSMRFVGFVAMPMLQSSRWQMMASYFCGFQWRKTPIGSWAALPLDPGSGSKPWLEVIAKRMRDNSKSKDILSISKSKRTQRNRTIRTSLSSLRAFLVEIASVLQDLFGQDLSEQTPTTRNKTGQEKRTTRSLTTRSMRIWPPRHRKSFLKKWIKNWASTDVALWFWGRRTVAQTFSAECWMLVPFLEDLSSGKELKVGYCLTQSHVARTLTSKSGHLLILAMMTSQAQAGPESPDCADGL